MNRYNGDGQEEGYFQDDEDQMSESPQEVEAIIDLHGGLLDAMELDLTEQGLNQALLDTAIKLAKQDIWWYFRSPAKKLRRVEKMYRRLTGLVREGIKEEEE